MKNPNIVKTNKGIDTGVGNLDGMGNEKQIEKGKILQRKRMKKQIYVQGSSVGL